MNRWWFNPRMAPFACLAMLFGGLVLDLNSEQALVVAIIYNIPIAVSGVLLSRKLTIWTVVLSLAANFSAGYDNAVAAGGVERITLANRGFAALSFLLVGVMSLLFEQSSEEVDELSDAEEDSERERALRHFLTELSGPLEPPELISGAAKGLRKLLGADAVVITGLDGDRFAEPRWVEPGYSSVASVGKLASWAVDALPVTATPVITVRSDEGIMSVGRLRCTNEQDLIVLAARPDRRQASAVLGEALAGLEPLRERALVMQTLQTAAQDLSARQQHAESDAALDRPPTDDDANGAQSAEGSVNGAEPDAGHASPRDPQPATTDT